MGVGLGDIVELGTRHPTKLMSYTLNLNPAIREVIAKVYAQWALSLSDAHTTGNLRHWCAPSAFGRKSRVGLDSRGRLAQAGGE